MTLPNFLILGAPKCGSTSAHRYLRQHPEVFMPSRKEIHYFSPLTLEIIPAYPRLPSIDSYAALFKNADGQKAIGEASPTYLYDRQSPELILNALGPDVKMVAFLRNPVRGAFSAWSYNVMHGETLSFREALAAERAYLAREAAEGVERKITPRRTADGPAYYAKSYCYAPQLRRYLDVFGPKQLKVFIFEEFFRPNLPQYAELCRFLGIDDQFTPTYDVHNPARTYRTEWARRWATTSARWRKPLGKLPLSAKVRLVRAFRALTMKPGAAAPLEPDLADELQKYFAPDVREVETILARDLSKIWF